MGRNYTHENLDQEFAFQHLIDNGNFSMDFHCHDHIEVYLSISGGEHFIIDDRIYDIRPGDMFVNNPFEVHRVTALQNEPYERYALSFKHALMLPYCTADTDLLHYVYRRPSDFSNKISLSDHQFQCFTELTKRYEELTDDTYANDVMRKLVFIEILALTAQFYRQPVQIPAEITSAESMDMISLLLEYIGEHLTDRLALDDLAKQIGVSKYHLCKIFKAKTGTTINQYIVTRRIAEAKYFLAKGVPVTEACYQSGFNDLSHFIRTFHNIVGVSPGKYFSTNRQDEQNYYIGPEM